MAKGKPPPFQKKPAAPPPKGKGGAKPNPFAKSKAPPFAKARPFADGGSVKMYEGKSVPVPPRAEPPKPKPPEEPKQSLMDRAKEYGRKTLGIGGTPVITGGLSDAIKRRDERMDAVTRGEPDPGQKRTKEYARGGKVKRM